MKFSCPEKTVAALLIAGPLVGIWAQSAPAAENLQLRKGISFNEDKDGGFPIVADKMDDTTAGSGTPTFLFFAASGDLNSNRQAKRVVSLYGKYKTRPVKFIVIDVDHPANDQARNLIKKHYKGYIPCQAILDRSGNATWSKSGEVGEGDIAKELDGQLK